MEGNGGEAEIMKKSRRSARAVNVAFEEVSFRLQSSSDKTHRADMKDESESQSVCLCLHVCAHVIFL